MFLRDRETPSKAKMAVVRIKDDLADAKAEVLERVREYQVRLPPKL
jgi:hypothetical protein